MYDVVQSLCGEIKIRPTITEQLTIKSALPGFWQVRLQPSKQHFSLPSHCESHVHWSTYLNLHRRPSGTDGHWPGLAVTVVDKITF